MYFIYVFNYIFLFHHISTALFQIPNNSVKCQFLVLFLVSIFVLFGVFLCKQMKLILSNLSNKQICWNHKEIYRMKTLRIFRILDNAGEQSWKMDWNQWILESWRSSKYRERSVSALTRCSHWVELPNDFPFIFV